MSRKTLPLAQEVIDLAYPQDTRHALLSRAGDAMMAQARAAAFASGRRPRSMDGEQQN